MHEPRPRARAHVPPARSNAARQRGDEPPRVDRVVAGDVEREPDRRRQRGLGAARLASGSSRSTSSPSSRAEGEQAVERLGLVAVARDDAACRSCGSPGRPDARQLGAERREAARGAQPELEQRALAELGLGDRREHAGGDVPGAGLAGVEHDGAQPALRGAPRAGEADRPAADDGDVVACC